MAEIAGSIREFGFTNPVLIDLEGGIIAGHGRVLAARQLEMGQIPTICLSGLSETQRRAYRLTDNKMALNAGWDPELLRLELGELELDGFDLALTGFSDIELGELRADRTEGLTDPDLAADECHPLARARRSRGDSHSANCTSRYSISRGSGPYPVRAECA